MTCVNLSAPVIASTLEARAIMVAERLVSEQLHILVSANKALFGIASLRMSAEPALPASPQALVHSPSESGLVEAM